MMALLFAVLAFAQSATAFYDANLGRWINRDPIEEEGGINLHAFVSNNPVSAIDLFGLAEVTKMSDGFVIEVGKCEIVRHIGHGNRKGWPRFYFPTSKLGGCPAGAGFIGCYASEINQGIPAKGGTILNGSPTDSAGGVWDDVVSPKFNGPDWTKAVKDTDDGIKSMVNDWLKNKSKCCPSVTVTEVYENGNTKSTKYTQPIP